MSRTRAAFGILLLALVWLAPPATSVVAPDPQGPEHLRGLALKSGDLIFRRGLSVRSHLVLSAEDGEFSHVGVIVVTSHGVRVAHAAPAEAPGEPEASKVEPLARFLDPSRASRVAIYRLDPAQVPEAAEHAQRAAEAARRMAERAIPFDYRFDVTTPDALYCTELVLRAYAQAGVDLKVHTATILPFLPQPVIFPADLMRSPRIKRVDQPRQPPSDTMTAP